MKKVFPFILMIKKYLKLVGEIVKLFDSKKKRTVPVVLSSINYCHGQHDNHKFITDYKAPGCWGWLHVRPDFHFRPDMIWTEIGGHQHLALPLLGHFLLEFELGTISVSRAEGCVQLVFLSFLMDPQDFQREIVEFGEDFCKFLSHLLENRGSHGDMSRAMDSFDYPCFIGLL